MVTPTSTRDVRQLQDLGWKYVPGQGFAPPTNTLAPPPTEISPQATSTITGIEPQALEAILYGKDIPVFIGGKARIGGRIIEGPFFGGTTEAPTVSYIASHALAANPSGTRTITEFSLRGRVVWTVTDGALMPGLTVEFKTGSETQTAFPSSITRYGSSAIAYRSHILSCVTDLPLTPFAGVVPFPSVMVEDSSFGDPDDGITRTDAIETILRYARLDDADFEVDVTGSDIAWIIGQKTELIPLLQSFRQIFVNWNVNVTDKIRVIEPAGFSVDAVITRDNHIARSMKFTRLEPLTKPREKNYQFIDIDRDYEPNVATARQELFPYPTTASIESESIELPIVTQASQAMVDVNYALFQSEVARKQLSYNGMVSLIGHEAGDGISFADDDFLRFRGRVTEIVKNAADWTVDVTAETWLNCELASEGDVTHLSCHEARHVPTVTTHTFEDVDFGLADANRYIVVGVNLTMSNTGNLVTSVTIGGVSATQAVVASSTLLGAISTIFYASVPSGTSGDIVITCDGTFSQVTAHVYRAVVSGLALSDTASTFATTASAVTVSIDIPASGIAIMAACARQGAGLVVAGAESDCIFTNDLVVSGTKLSASHKSNLADVNRPISVDPTSIDVVTLVAISFAY